MRGGDKGGHGWDFVEVGMRLQYKEDSLIANVTVIKDRSTDEFYRFVLRAHEATEPLEEDFEVAWAKGVPGTYNGAVRLMEAEEYFPLPWGNPWPWVREEAPDSGPPGEGIVRGRLDRRGPVV